MILLETQVKQETGETARQAFNLRPSLEKLVKVTGSL